MKKLIILIVVLAAVGVGAGAFYMRRGGPEPKVDTLQVTRGDIADIVLSTGTLEAVTTVNVGTQVSGMVQQLYADFNSIVHRGQVVARLDPSLIQTAIEQRRASVTRAEADIERLKVGLADAQRKLTQAKGLWEKQLIPRDQLDTAEMNVKTLDVQIRSADAGLVQAKADLNTQTVNLAHTVIESPIDGIVISRQVEPGQTVAASMNAPTLFIIAGDLTKMRVIANIDEADVGRLRPGQPVTFRVDAYPNDTFRGEVEQVRLQPTTVQNVVTYSTVILVSNPERKLKPGMTANVTVEIARRSNVLRLPAAALRFRPTADHFTALNLPVPPEIANRSAGLAGGRGRDGGRGGAGGTGTGAPGATPATPPTAAPQQQTSTQPGAQPPSPQPRRQREGESRGGGDASAGSSAPGTEARGGGRGQGGGGVSGGGGRGGFDPNMTPEERQKRLQERLANMSPEERQRWEQRMKEGFGRGEGGGRGGGAAPTGGRQTGDTARFDVRQGITTRARGGASIASGATTIDELFAPVVIPERPGTVWVWADNQLKSVRIRHGITDGTWNEVVEGDLKEGQEVVTNITTGVEAQTTPGQGGSQNPLMGPQRGGRGGPGGGGGGRGGGR
jgi:HlyD family secretion protein